MEMNLLLVLRWNFSDPQVRQKLQHVYVFNTKTFTEEQNSKHSLEDC